jgi:hypothetical protein
LEFAPGIYISKSREILELGKKGKLFNLKLSSTLPSFSIFGHQGVLFWVFEVRNLKDIKNLEIIGKGKMGPAHLTRPALTWK